MKLKRPERALQTSCQQCQFAVYDNDTRLGKSNKIEGTQTGCQAGRLDKLQDYVIEGYNGDQKFYVIDCLCNMFRGPDWNAGVRDLDLARKELEPLFSIIIDASSPQAESVDVTAKSISEIAYDHKKISVLFSVDISSSKKHKKVLLETFKTLEGDGYKPQMIVALSEKHKDLETFRRGAGCSYFIKTKLGQKIPSTFFRDIDSALNDDMVRAVVFDREGMSAISFPVYAARAAEHKTYGEFESSIRTEAKEMELYSQI
jgi:hypothetical protein